VTPVPELFDYKLKDIRGFQEHFSHFVNGQAIELVNRTEANLFQGS
jgi:hypothetical protein